jgi:acetyl-CoA C-acetyltransferase
VTPERAPVIVGVGQINDRPADPEDGLDSAQLMEAALRRADADAGGSWLSALDSLTLVEQISCPWLGDFERALAARIGASPRICTRTWMASGDSPVLLLNEAANRIGAGEITVAAIAGGEALRSAAARALPFDKDALRAIAARHAPPLQSRYGLVAPTEYYPLYENATRAAWGQTLAEAQAESAAIWESMSRVAAANPDAWLRDAVDADMIATPGPGNRPVVHPYTKLMIANSAVNQGAGFIVTSLAEARRRGVPENRLIYVGRGAAAHEVANPLQRDRYDSWLSLKESIEQTLAFSDLSAASLDHVELYSCFPCVPKMARRVLGWPLDKPVTMFGGLTFGGGPIGNAMSHAVAAMTHRLRGTHQHGLLFANGGFATHNHSITLSGAPIPAASFPHDFDVQARADAGRGPVPDLIDDAAGRATIETYTVLYGRDGAPQYGIVIARTAAGARTLARVPGSDAATIAFLTDGVVEPVGAQGMIALDAEGLQCWTRA